MTKLIRVQDETYAQLQKLAGKLQARHGTRFSLDKTIQTLFEEKTTQKSKGGVEKSQKNTEADTFADSLKWFSIHHKAYKPEKNQISSTKSEQKTSSDTPAPTRPNYTSHNKRPPNQRKKAENSTISPP